LLLGDGARKELWRLVDMGAVSPYAWWWPARWEPQEEGMMSVAASFPSVKKPRFNVDLEEERRWWLKVFVEPAHTQISTLFPTCDEVVNLTGLLETKVMSVLSGKQ
jgi:hypothetical protein